MVYYLKTLGRLSIHPGAPEGSPLLTASKSLAVLAYLASYRESSRSRDRIAALFWPDAERSRARHSLRQALYYLTRKVGEQLVEAGERDLRVRRELLEVDFWEFERAVEAGAYERVLELYDGPFLTGVREKLGRELETWVEARNERIWTGVQAAFHRLVLRSLEEDDSERAVSLSRHYVELNPFHEDAQLALVRSLAADGRPVAAIQAFESYRSLLRQELGDDPGAELEQWVEELRRRVFRSPSAEAEEADRGDAAGSEDGSEPAGTTADRRQPAPVEATGPHPPPLPTSETASSRAGEAGTQAPAPGRGGERSDPTRIGDVWWPLLAAAAGVVLLVLVVRADLRFGRVDERALPARPWARAATAGPPTGGALLVPRGDSLVLEPAGPARGLLAPPGGGAPAGQVRTPRGYDLALLEEDGTPGRILTTRPHDETPLAWSPDGRLLVFQDGFMGPDGIRYRRHLEVVDVVSGETRPLPPLDTRPGGRADWHPSGAWIVFGARSEEGDHEVFRVRPDGSELRNLSRSPGFDGEPAVSPDGRWIAFVSERGGSRSVHLLAVGGDRSVPVVDTGFDAHQPVWLDPDRLLYLSTRGEETDVWIYDLDDEETRRVTHRGDFRYLGPGPSEPTVPWIEALRIRPRHAVVAPGQWLRLAADGIGPEGRTVPVPRGALEWSSEGDGIVVREDEEGLFRVAAPGSAGVSVAVPGWRTASLPLESRPLVRRKARPLFHEAWSDGIDPRRWAVYGSPEPTVEGREGRFPRVFRNNGDAHFDSGVASRARFDVRDGATLEVWARVPVRDRHYQDLKLALVPDPAPPGTEAWSAPGPTALAVGISGDPDGTRLSLFRSGRPVPPPDSLDAWRRYALQIDGDGVPSLVVDGRLHWRGEALAPEVLADSVHVVLAGRTVETDVVVGPVTLFRGLRYTFP